MQLNKVIKKRNNGGTLNGIAKKVRFADKILGIFRVLISTKIN